MAREGVILRHRQQGARVREGGREQGEGGWEEQGEGGWGEQGTKPV